MGREGKEELERRKCRLNLHVVYLWRVPFRLFRVICAARVFVSLLSLSVSLSLSLSWSLDFQRKNDLGTLWSLTCEIHYIPSSSTFLFSTRVRGWTRVETIFKRGNNYYCYYYYIVESFRVDLSFLFFFFYVTIWNLIKGTVLWTLSSLHLFFSEIFRVQT